MTTNRTRPRVVRPAVGHRDHTVIGTADQVANVLANHSHAGTLIAVANPGTLSDGRVAVIARIATTTSPPTHPPASNVSPPAQRRWLRIGAIAAAVAAPIVGVTAAIAYLIGAVVTFIAEHAAALAGLAVLAALIAAVLRGRSGNGRRHCPGC
jgi:hypothetical protein